MGNTIKKSLLEDDKIVEMGVAVFDVNDVPGQNKPFISPHYIISVCHSGNIELEYDVNRTEYNPHDLAIIYPQHTLIAHKVSPDYRATLIAVSADMYAKMGRFNFSTNRFVYEQLPHFHLTDSQYDDMMSFIDTIRRITRLDIKGREDIVVSAIYILSQIVDSFHDATVGTAGASNKSLSNRLYNAIIENCKQHRDVQFYARLFHLSPKYFSQVVQQQTGHAAGYWIQLFVVLAAKQMLTYEPDASVQAIADRFGFPDQATFCRYFKRGTGLSPTQFRSDKYKAGDKR